jgi:serine protease AprX
MTETHNHLHGQNHFAVIPTAEKLNANTELTGKGITIAFLDSGFYPHPDFESRIIKFHDVSGEENSLENVEPQSHHWHGTQTVAVCAGDGKLSDGIYRGLASNANLVLVKVSETGRISDKSIEKGLLWVIENRVKFNIKIVNMSLGGDDDVPLNESRINKLAEELVKLGVVVTVAAGNSDERRSIPPANAPSVITVGGYSDENQFENNGFDLYHSNFGETIDGIVKPEIIAPAMFVAAPILPETKDYEAAETLSMIANSPNYTFRQTYLDNWEKAELPEYILSTDVDTAKQLVEQELHRAKIVSTHYKHVDGTSFAAPITASVAAQMLEANPKLTPASIKGILVSTASRLVDFPAIRQGFGVLNASLAVKEAIKEKHFFYYKTLTSPNIEADKIVFLHHDDNAQSICLAGDFNNWNSSETSFTLGKNGIWRAEISNLQPGKYRYKFVVNGENWIEDHLNGMKEEDGYGGFNSILHVK